MESDKNLSTLLPYFDVLLEDFAEGNTDVIECFGLHVHWGYWENPGLADGSTADFAQAAENLVRKMSDLAETKNGMKILDCGCGFGGNISSLNQRFSNIEFVGLNIDPRQLDRAKSQVKATHNNQIEFVEGDACQLPFSDASFDLVFAVECIFHFPSREKFFQEARRVLKPGGKLVLSDFVPREVVLSTWSFTSPFSQPLVTHAYGQVDATYSLSKYRDLAKSTGFQIGNEIDITQNTIPTYQVIRKLQFAGDNKKAALGNWLIEIISRLTLIRYLILSYVKPF
ncbi:class I SAM-dependent methyltransferase [Merismopedia glauca]|uniref:SAM-dependent methyltransferase n=1 Tax=Merismopedia glauca CCAP 1448/3 TaxID=1296344 RepID=A0A2T1C1N4_9CYAN|nr:class I SAM-dependent methyltransferase [Merismopedia glauca]PSB02171.1 SAM-dependent methyltransferase [Merismopedia glauca CCAP 1448/3]